MKKYSLILIMLISLISCKDFLVLQPEDQINSATFYQTPNDFNTAMIGAYSGLQILHNASTIDLSELTTDNIEVTWTSPTTSETECDQTNITSTNDFVRAVWTNSFTAISRANNVLVRIESATFDENLKAQYRGEALYLRAYCYFYLVQYFGDLPIVKETFSSPDEIAAFDMTRKPAPEVYALIIDDLKKAATNLANVTTLKKDRASAGAAKALLGKVYLTMKNYANSATVLKEVIDMNKYSLVKNFQTLCTNGNTNLAETLFEIRYLSGNLGEGNSYSSLFTPFLFNMAIFPGNMTGAGRLCPTKEVYAAYETGDLRRDATIGYPVKLANGNTENFYYGKKFVDFTTGITNDGGVNYLTLRYADVLLMFAEALNETGKTTEAHTYLNLVRARAGVPIVSGLSKADFALALEKERRVEFVFEGMRWFDLVRTGRAQTVLNAYFTSKGLNFKVDAYELLMPIPQSEIDINPKLVQNTGY